MPTLISAKRSRAVLRVDGFYLYQTGWQIHPLINFAAGATTYEQAIYPLYFAESASSLEERRSCGWYWPPVQHFGVNGTSRSLLLTSY
jgi:hypothetical protein